MGKTEISAMAKQSKYKNALTPTYGKIEFKTQGKAIGKQINVKNKKREYPYNHDCAKHANSGAQQGGDIFQIRYYIANQEYYFGPHKYDQH